MIFNLKNKEIRKLREERSKDLINIEKTMSNIGLSLELMSQKRYFPTIFLMEAITTYECIFDIPSIFYASLSFEVAIWIRTYEELDKLGKVTTKDLEQIKTLSKLIDKSYELKLIDDQHKVVSHNIRKLRNGYSHYQNTIHSLLFMNDMNSTTIQNLVMVMMKSQNQQYIKELEIVAIKAQKVKDLLGKEIRPMFAQVTNKETVEFMKERYDQYYNWLAKEIDKNPKQIIEQLKHIGDIKYVRKYDQKRFDALDMIKWNYEMLIHLKFINDADINKRRGQMISIKKLSGTL